MTLALVYAGDTKARDFFWRMRNTPDAVRYSPTGAVSAEQHALWWSVTHDLRWVVWREGRMVGTVQVSSQGRVSIVIRPDSHRRGLATAVLRELPRHVRKAQPTWAGRLWGEIAWENRPSQRAFGSAGWRPLRFEQSVPAESSHPGTRGGAA